jgi:hypothetical protein
MVPMCALALYGAARLPRSWSLVVPLGAWFLSDLLIDMGHGYPYFHASRWTSYGVMGVLVMLGWLMPRQAGLPARLGAAFGGQTLFFLASNLAVWVGGEGYGFPMTLAGLISTYAVALPFYGNGLVADGAATALLFGVEGLLVARARRAAGPFEVK